MLQGRLLISTAVRFKEIQFISLLLYSGLFIYSSSNSSAVIANVPHFFQQKMCESVRPSYPTPTSFLKITSLYCSNDLLHNKLVLAVWMKCLKGRGRALPLYLEGTNLNLCLQSNLSRRASRVAAAVHSDSEVGLAICGSAVLFAGLVISRWMVPVC